MISKDEVEKFIEYINFYKISLKISVEPSIYETNPFLISNKPSMIEYAAFFGSIQIFKYLFINNVAIEEQKLSLYSIHSNRSDMIHLFESYGILKTEEIIEGYFLESIKCHHKQISEYIANNLIKRTIDIEKEENDQNEKIVKNILKYSNYYYFPKEIERNYSFFYLCKYKYSRIIHLFLKTKKQEIEKKINQSKSERELLRESADENNIYLK